METPLNPASESTTYQTTAASKTNMIPTTSPYFDKSKIEAINDLISSNPHEALRELTEFKDLVFEA